VSASYTHCTVKYSPGKVTVCQLLIKNLTAVESY